MSDAQEERSTYVVIYGLHTSAKPPVDYVASIVYGNPRIEAVLVGSHFVAVCEYPASQVTQAIYTLERMGSFPHGAKLMVNTVEAMAQFGAQVRSYAPGTVVDLEPSYAP